MAKTSKTVIVFGLVGLALLAVLAYAAVANTQLQAPVVDDEGNVIIDVQCGDNEPYIDLTVLNRLNKGSEVTVGVDATVNGVRKGSVTLSSQKFNVNDNVKLLLNATGYIDKVIETKITKCGQNDVSTTIDASTAAGVSFDMWQKSTDLTDAVVGGANNATGIAAGGSDVYTLYVKGADNAVTGDLVYVIELGSTQNVSSITMVDSAGNELVDADVPNFYADTISSAYKDAFIIPSFDNAVEKEFSITVSLVTGKLISGAVYTTAYAKQAFVDNDGSYKVGVTNTDNTATQYEWTDDVDFYLEAA
jgi:hypothetical protein